MESEEMAEMQKKLRGTASMKRWFFIGGAAAALSGLLDYATSPSGEPYLFFQILLAVGCIGYGVFLSSRIAKMKAELARRHDADA
ncbi:hypothetical protein FJU30_15970 [Affinibrenneria salicis]|uniref:Uncharacterized protein n=1 Tax=Affinibrenneria salicis TaxID=2590031 RepID=A0A5J5FX14_9GAMM|nr:hypothetical protein [Affinibrenneria salicis]KAA8998498.1 hypothetical protein FJU30_15970 [Affinibrenneria salicis]